MCQRSRTLRRPVGRTDLDFIRDMETRQHLGGALHNWPVVRTSHNDAYHRLCHAINPYPIPLTREGMIFSLDTPWMQSVASSSALREGLSTAGRRCRPTRADTCIIC